MQVKKLASEKREVTEQQEYELTKLEKSQKEAEEELRRQVESTGQHYQNLQRNLTNIREGTGEMVGKLQEEIAEYERQISAGNKDEESLTAELQALKESQKEVCRDSGICLIPQGSPGFVDRHRRGQQAARKQEERIRIQKEGIRGQTPGTKNRIIEGDQSCSRRIQQAHCQRTGFLSRGFA